MDAAAALVSEPEGGNREGGRERRPSVTLPVCKDGLRGRCTRPDCKFAHPPPNASTSTSQDGVEVVTVCNDSLRGRCSRGAMCKYFHPPSHLASTFAAQVGITPAPAVPALPFSAAALHGAPASPLPDYSHAYLASLVPHAHPHFAPAMPAPLPAAKSLTRPALEVCRDFVKGRCKREASECRFAHTNPTSPDGSLVVVCQDFLKDRCERATCRYFHPESHLRSRIQEISMSKPGVAGGGGRGPAGLGAGLVLGPNPLYAVGPGLDPGGDSNALALSAYQAAAYSAYAASLYGDAGQPNAKKLRGEDGSHGAVPGDGGSSGLEGALNGANLGPPSSYLEDDRLRKTSMEVPLSYYSSGLNHAYAAAAAAAAAQYAMPTPSAPPALPGSASSGDRLAVCRDFLKDRCSRPSCRYVHPESHVQVVDNFVVLCRDSVRGRCERHHCRFYHPTTTAAAPDSPALPP